MMDTNLVLVENFTEEFRRLANSSSPTNEFILTRGGAGNAGSKIQI
jgi:hypothetical protein